MPVATVFGNSNADLDSSEYSTAEELGKLIAQAGYDVATGGYGGVMEAALRGAAEFDVKRIGITEKQYHSDEINNYVQREIPCGSYLRRLDELLNISDIYFILPGGSGTLLELAAAWALSEREILTGKKIICIGEQWQEVIQILGFYSEKMLETADLINVARNAKEAVEMALVK